MEADDPLFRCPPGYRGQKCEIDVIIIKPSGNHVGLVVGLVLAFVIAAILLVIGYYLRKHKGKVLPFLS